MWYARDMTDPRNGVNYGPFPSEEDASIWLHANDLPGYVTENPSLPIYLPKDVS